MADDEVERSREAKRPRKEAVDVDEENTDASADQQANSGYNNIIDEVDEDDGGEEEDDEEEEEAVADASCSSFSCPPENLWQFLQAEAQSQGVPLEYLLHQIRHHQHDNNDDDATASTNPTSTGTTRQEYPKRPTSLKDVAELIQSDACQRILILAGAGMSVASGIPDFRSPKIGLYDTIPVDRLSATLEQKQQIALEPSFALDQELFLENPCICLELLREFILGVRDTKWKATLAHRFVELLHEKFFHRHSRQHKLVRWYTQNIDGLEDQCHSLPRRKVIPVHGSMDRAECATCGANMDFATFCTLVETNIKDIAHPDAAQLSSKPIPCQHCGRNTVKPSIVLFRGSLPREFFHHIPKDTKEIDLLLIIGTSLRVVPANTIVKQMPKRCVRVLINREPAGQHLGLKFGETNDDDDDAAAAAAAASIPTQTSSSRDYFAQGEIDSVILELAGHLGWWDDLAQFLPNDQLPEKSARQLRDCLNNDRKLRGALKTEEQMTTPSNASAAAAAAAASVSHGNDQG